MKRWIHRSVNYNEQMIEFDIFVELDPRDIKGASMMDLNDPAFYDFESNILNVCEMHDFELEDSYESSSPDSISQYYVYVKTNPEGTRLKVYLRIRVSDHVVPDRIERGKISTHKQRSKKFTNDQAREYAQEKFNQARGYRARDINIVMNDEFYTSYESALRDIEKSLDEFDPE